MKNNIKNRLSEKLCVSVLVMTLLPMCFSGCQQTNTNEIVQSAAPANEQSYSDAKISYLGPEGTYTQEACQNFFDNNGSYIPYTTVPEAVEALTSGESDYAVIPQENTIGGAVVDYVDTLIATENVSVVGEVELPISQNLLVLPGTELSDIKTVYSHKQGIAQGKEWLSKNLPDAEVIEVSSTAEGAKMVSEGNDKSCAAIASAGCADVYGLEIMERNIQNNDKNKTRFYVLSTNEPKQESLDRLAFVISGKAADLPKLMSQLNDKGITLVTIHDRPLKTELGEYNYILECEGCTYEDYKSIASNETFTFRYLGSFPVDQVG